MSCAGYVRCCLVLHGASNGDGLFLIPLMLLPDVSAIGFLRGLGSVLPVTEPHSGHATVAWERLSAPRP